jgi:hypothetical protein
MTLSMTCEAAIAISTDTGALGLNLSVGFVFSLQANNPKIRTKAT